MKELTENQAKILSFICDQQESRGFPPTIREIGEEFNLNSTGSVRDYLAALEKKGYINRNSRTSRGIEIVGRKPNQTRRIPIVADVAAGWDTISQPIYDEEVVVDVNYLSQHAELFALKVSGDSMKDSGILDGDLVFVRKQDHAQDGDIVAAVIDEETTIKHYWHEGDQVRLQPANDDMEPIYITEDQNAFIGGKVVGVIREY